MINRAEAISLSVSNQPLTNKSLKAKALGALLFAAAFALGLSPAASAAVTTPIDVLVLSSANVPLAGVGVCACHFGPNGPDSTSTMTFTDATGHAYMSVTDSGLGVRYEILASSQGWLPTLHAQYTSPYHSNVYADGSGSPLTAGVNLYLNGNQTGEIDANVINAPTSNGIILGSVRLASNNNISAGDALGFTDGSGSGTIQIFNVGFKPGNTYVLNVFDPASNKTVAVGVTGDLGSGTYNGVAFSSAAFGNYLVDFTGAGTNSNVQNNQTQGSAAGNLGLTGVITDADNGNAPVPFIGVQIYVPSSCNNGPCGVNYWTNTDATGHYSFYGIATSTGGPNNLDYAVSVNQQCLPNSVGGSTCYAGMQTGSGPSGCDGGGRCGFNYSGSLQTKNYALHETAPGTGVLNVVVVDSNGNPMPQSWISVFPDGTNWTGGDSFAGNHPGLSNYNAQAPAGSAQFTGLYSGNYNIQVNNNFSGSNQPIPFDTNAGSPVRITVDESGGASNDVYFYDQTGTQLSCGAPGVIASDKTLCVAYDSSPNNTVYIVIPTQQNSTGLLYGSITFPSSGVNLSTDPIMISLQPQCNNGCNGGGGGFTVLNNASTGPVVNYAIRVASGTAYYMQINANYWGRIDGGRNNVDLTSTGTIHLDMTFGRAGRLIGKLYTPSNAVFIPSNGGGSFTGASINANGNQSHGANYTQVQQDGSYAIGALPPGKYDLDVSAYGNPNPPSFTTPVTPQTADIVAGQDTYVDVHAVAGVLVQPQFNPVGVVPPVQGRLCNDGDNCQPENWVVKTIPQGSPLSSNATLRNFLNLNAGSDSKIDFGFSTDPSQNGGRGCNNGTPVLPNSWCATTLPTPGAYDFYFIRSDDFGQGIVGGPKPSFVIMGAAKAYSVDPSSISAQMPTPQESQVYDSTHPANPPLCYHPGSGPGTGSGPLGPGYENASRTCDMTRVEPVVITPVIAGTTTFSPSWTGQATVAGAVTAVNAIRQQDFQAFNGDFGNFMKYIPLVTLYDSSGSLVAGGAVLPKPQFMTPQRDMDLSDSVATGNWTKFQTTFNGWVSASGGIGYEIRGLAPNRTYSLVLTTPNYPPYQTIVKTGVAGSTTTVPGINLDASGSGETLVVTVISSTTGNPIPNAPVTLSGPNYDARTFTTVDNGTVTIAGLAASNYTLGVTVQGYAQGSANLNIVGTGKLSATVALISANSSVAGTVYGMSPSGNVIEAGADVFAYDDTLNAQHAGDPKFSLPLYHTVTSTAGYYRFDGLLSNDTFKITAKVPGFYVGILSTTTTGADITGTDFILPPKPLDINVFGRPFGNIYTFTIQNPSDFSDGNAWIQFANVDPAFGGDPNAVIPPFYSTDSVHPHTTKVDFEKISDNQLQLEYPAGAGFIYNLHIEAQSYGGDTVVKDVPFRHDSLRTVQQIDTALLGDNSTSGSGTKNNQVLLDPTGTDGSALTIPPGSMIPVSTDVVPSATFNAVNPLDAAEAGVFGSTAVFASNVYDLTLSSVNFTGTGFDLTVSYDPATTKLSDLDMYVYVNDSNGITTSALRPQGGKRTTATGKWWSLKALGFPLVINAQNHTITAKGLLSVASVLSLKNSPMAAINTGKGFRPNTAYRALGISPNERSAFAVLRPSQQVKKPATAPAGHVPVANVSSITWTWGTVANAIDYRFYPSTGGNPIAIPGPTITLTGLLPNHAYGGKVTAMNNSGEGPMATLTTAYTLAAAPSGTSIDQVNVSSVSMSWTDGVNPAGTKYKVEWAKQATPNTFTSKVTTITYTSVTGLIPNTTYFIRVRSVNAKSAAGPNDAAQTVWTFPLKPAAAPAVKINPALTTPIAQLATGQITFSWAAVPGAEAYEFYPQNGDAMVVTTNTYVIVTGMGNNAVYGAKVRARNINGFGPLTASVTGYALADTPNGTTLTPGVKSMLVTWDASSNASTTTYRVEYKLHSATAWTVATTTVSANSPAQSKLITSLTTGANYDFRVRSLNVKGIPGVPDAVASALPTVTRTATVAEAPAWKWEIPAGEIAKPGTVTPGTSAALAKVLAFPNPLLPGQPGINFVYVPDGASIKITSPAGVIVHTFTVKGGSVSWNGTDTTGHKVPNGLYTAVIESAGAQRVITLAIQR